TLQCLGLLSEFEQCLTQSGEGILVLGVEDKSFLEASPSPRKFLACVIRVTDPNVQLYRVRVEREPLSKYVQRFVVLAFIVQLMRSLIILLGTQKRGSHSVSLPPTDRVAVLYNRITDLFKNDFRGRICPQSRHNCRLFRKTAPDFGLQNVGNRLDNRFHLVVQREDMRGNTDTRPHTIVDEDISGEQLLCNLVSVVHVDGDCSPSPRWVRRGMD